MQGWLWWALTSGQPRGAGRRGLLVGRHGACWGACLGALWDAGGGVGGGEGVVDREGVRWRDHRRLSDEPLRAYPPPPSAAAGGSARCGLSYPNSSYSQRSK